MAGKPELITELYRRVCLQVTSSPENWQAFLDSACRNYKCRFDEQLLIYMQKPDATAVLEYEKWNRRFGRWIKKTAEELRYLKRRSHAEVLSITSIFPIPELERTKNRFPSG